MATKPRWSEEEDALIWKHGPEVGYPGLHDLMPHRSHKAIRDRAFRIGVSLDNRRYWSEEEDALIRKHGPEVGSRGLHDLMPHWGRGAIRSRARRIGVSLSSDRPVRSVGLVGSGWASAPPTTVAAAEAFVASLEGVVRLRRSVTDYGYIRWMWEVGVGRRQWQVREHRAVWAFHNPDEMERHGWTTALDIPWERERGGVKWEIDHIDGDRSNNHPSNLRLKHNGKSGIHRAGPSFTEGESPIVAQLHARVAALEEQNATLLTLLAA